MDFDFTLVMVCDAGSSSYTLQTGFIPSFIPPFTFIADAGSKSSGMSV